MTIRQATARAHPNIAFIKYWGNTDHRLRLPMNPSISMNLDGLYAETEVEWTDVSEADTLTLNGQPQTGEPLQRVSDHLNVLRGRLGLQQRARVTSANNFPTGAGVASSAAAFAALTVAGAAAAGADLSERELTTIARQGSGSAARSVPGGFVVWHAGERDAEAYAESIAPPDHWDLVDVIAIISSEHKRVGSTAGHRSAETSDLQLARVAGAQARFDMCQRAILDRDFAKLADVMEADSNLMHAVMMTSRPPLFYWLPASLAIMSVVREWRTAGVAVCYTLDAGPNVHCICTRNDAQRVSEGLRAMSDVHEVRIAGVGGAAQVIARA